MHVQPWVPVALGQLGVEEVAGPGTNPQIAEWLAVVGLPADDAIANCGAFVCWVLKQCGLTWPENGAHARSFLDWGVPTPPVLGAFTVLWRDSPQSTNGHVGFFLDQDHAFLYLLSANVRDGVRVAAFDRHLLLGHRWPTGV